MGTTGPPPPPEPVQDPTSSFYVPPPPPATEPAPVDGGPGGPGGPTGGGRPGDDGGKRRGVLIGAIIVLALVAAGVIAALLLSGGKDDASKDQVTATDGTDTGASDDTTTTSEDTTTTEATTTTTAPEDVPDLVGKTLDEARALVDGTGVTIKAVNVANEDKPSGTILEQDPPAGGPHADTIIVKVARPPVKTYLAELTPVEGSTPGLEPVTINANAFTHPTSFGACEYSFDTESNRDSAGYDLGRKYTRFTAKVGIPDSSASGIVVKFEVVGDGNKLAEATTTLGELKDIDVDVTGVLRLSLYTTGVTCTGETPGVFADPQLTSPPDPED
jgi:hypothetical protein